MKNKPKTLKLEYYLLPYSGIDHIQEFMYRVVEPKNHIYGMWTKFAMPYSKWTAEGEQSMRGIAERLSNMVPALKSERVKVYECVIKRKKKSKK